MNSFAENLNAWGGNFLSFAWPMLWQSSLLIALMFVLDFLLARKIRASVCYALWLAVLVKLLLPPTLALPTSAAWWLTQSKPAPAPVAKNFTVTYNDAPTQINFPQPTIPLPAPLPPKLEFAGWLMLVSDVVSAGLLLWLAVRWWQVGRIVQRATFAEKFSESLAEAMRLGGAPNSDSARLKIVEDTMSPAVCGLVHPVILLSRALAEKLSAAQLRAVLLHEIFHLRRRDVWVNCAQALLQIVYWWHPLLWVANARIRRVREEAVDDAVMLALRADADAYAPTLLEVAKLAFQRPLMSLGLVGIMESRSALRQRIERLVDFRAPRTAGLTVFSAMGILAFSAVALPMGEAPTPRTNEIKPSVTAPQNNNSFTINGSSGRGENRFSLHRVFPLPPRTNPPTILVTAHFFHMSGVDFQNVFSSWKFKHDAANVGSWIAAGPQPFSSILSQLKSSGLKQFSAPRAVTISGNAVTMSIGNGTNKTEFDCTPVATNGQVNLTFFYQVVEPLAGILVTNQFQAVTLLQNQGGVVVSSTDMTGKSGSNLVALVSAEIITNSARVDQRLNSVIKRTDGVITNTGVSRPTILEKLNRIRFDNVAYNDLPLSEVLRQLSENTRLADQEHKGINFLINPNADQPGPAKASTTTGILAGIDPATGLPAALAGEKALDIGNFSVKLNLTDARLADVLAAILEVAQNPSPGDKRTLSYTIKDYGIVFQPKPAESPQLFTREFKVDTNIFLNGSRSMGMASGLVLTNVSISKLAAQFFTNLGVNLETPPGKAVFYNERNGKFLVRATEQDLDKIERIVFDTKVDPGPQIHIKARFLELPHGAVAGFNQLLGQQVSVWPVPTHPVFSDMVNGSPVFRSGAPGAVSAKPVSAAQRVSILTRTNFNAMLRALESRGDVESLGEPEVTTLSGRQTQMRVTQMLELVTNLVYREDATNGPIVSQMGKVETGPILDVVPGVLSDGYTINLTVIPSLTKFLGYDKSTNTLTAYNRAGDKFNVPTVSPRFAIQQAVATLNLWDNQTAVISGIPSANYVNGSVVPGKPKSSDKDLLIFITATIVDPAGNRVHSEEDLPFAHAGVPEQPKQK